jgi:diaminohydroxyphosphoribosylaminopyrimidine deaminase / 5-amino-6-(5-phosphoribosylamino)uracil reductase
MRDPNPAVSGRGFERLRSANIVVEIAEESTHEAESLNEPFIHFMRTGSPLVTVKAALTLDGKIAAPQDNDGWITSDVARANVQQVRHQSDSILTGIGTVLDDDCLLTDRSGLERSRPLLRVVVDSQLRLPLHSKIVRSAASDVLVVCTTAAAPARRRALEEHGIQVLVADGQHGRTDLGAVVRYLSEQRYLSLMVEAGSIVNWAMLDGGIADKVFFYYAPKILGGLKSLPVAGGIGRQRRVDAILLDRLKVHSISTNEFAVEAYVVKGQ